MEDAVPGNSQALSSPEYATATELVAALAAKRVSSVELVDAAIARIEQFDGAINSVVVHDFENARRIALAADAALAQGERRPLLGLPITVKEAFDVQGLPTTWGDPDCKEWQPRADAVTVARLRAAGAVIIGKTNVPLMLRDWQTYNAIYGVTNNPWNPAFSPGGSSGGSAAALAAGFVSLELGSDLAGSLRSPAHSCGVFAHKPSHNLVPLRGLAPPGRPAQPGSLGFAVSDSLNFAVAGPMARSAADLHLGLTILAGPDELSDELDELSDGIGYKLALPPARHGDLRHFRVLVLDTHPLFPTAKEVQQALDSLSENLGHLGCHVSRSSPLLPDLAETARVYVMLRASLSSAGLPDDLYRQMQTEVESLSPDDRSLSALRLRGSTATHREWLSTRQARARLARQWRNLFTEFDVVLCPPMPTAALPHDHTPDRNTRWLDVDGAHVAYLDQVVWITIATLAGLPATVAPIGMTAAGLPIGVQILGSYLDDNTTLAFAGMIEREFGGFVPPRLGNS